MMDNLPLPLALPIIIGGALVLLVIWLHDSAPTPRPQHTPHRGHTPHPHADTPPTPHHAGQGVGYTDGRRH